MHTFAWVVVVLAPAALAGFAVRRLFGIQSPAKSKSREPHTAKSKTDENSYKISYISSAAKWSGSSTQALPFKTLTYKQYDCLEDARYGFNIVGAKPTERKKEQAHKTRAHGSKTVASLVRRGCLLPDSTGGHVITGVGLKALEVCDVRY